MADTQTVGPPAPPAAPPKTKTGAPEPERRMTGYAKVPLEELTLAEAADKVDDASWWDRTMPPVLLHYSQITPESYWELSVKEHRLLFEWLEKMGVVKDGDQPQT